ncbi:MAG: glycosyltransferase, partial [Gammaproteobacteria bacterium]
LAALALIKDRLPAFEFRVLGGGDKGPWEKLIRQFNIDGAVHLQGTLPSGEPVLSWLDDVDIYLQPSLKEGLPRALIEAMSRGCPALGSKVAGIPELLPSEVLHRPGDAKQLAALMMHMVSSQDWRAAQAKRNFDVAKGYAKEILEPRRRAFWQRFAVAAASQKGSHSGAMRNAIAS